MKPIFVSVNQHSTPVITVKTNNAGRITETNPVTVTSEQNNLMELGDVDMTNLANGSILVYDSQSKKFVASVGAIVPDIDSGTF